MEKKLFLYPLPEFVPLAESFFSNYECQNVLIFPTDRMPTLKRRSERICRFCGLDSFQTTFKNDPHIVPYFLGNKYGISDFECDVCNKLFCTYESHFAYYLGLNQTFSGSVSRSGVPTLKSSKKDLVVRAMNMFGIDGIMIQKTSKESDAIDWSIDDIISITFSKGSYKPSYIFKLLLKIALCSLPEDEISNYKVAFDYVKKEKSISAGIANIGIYEFKLGGSHSIPRGYLFKKKSYNIEFPTHQFALYFQNMIITFCLPYNTMDGWFNDGKKREVPIAPPLSTFPIKEIIPHHFYFKDMSSNELKRGEEQTIQFQMDSEQIKNCIRVDSKTGQAIYSETIDKNPKGIFLVPTGTSLKFEHFKQYPEPQMHY